MLSYYLDEIVENILLSDMDKLKKSFFLVQKRVSNQDIPVLIDVAIKSNNTDAQLFLSSQFSCFDNIAYTLLINQFIEHNHVAAKCIADIYRDKVVLTDKKLHLYEIANSLHSIVRATSHSNDPDMAVKILTAIFKDVNGSEGLFNVTSTLFSEKPDFSVYQLMQAETVFQMSINEIYASSEGEYSLKWKSHKDINEGGYHPESLSFNCTDANMFNTFAPEAIHQAQCNLADLSCDEFMYVTKKLLESPLKKHHQTLLGMISKIKEKDFHVTREAASREVGNYDTFAKCLIIVIEESIALNFSISDEVLFALFDKPLRLLDISNFNITDTLSLLYYIPNVHDVLKRLLKLQSDNDVMIVTFKELADFRKADFIFGAKSKKRLENRRFTTIAIERTVKALIDKASKLTLTDMQRRELESACLEHIVSLAEDKPSPLNDTDALLTITAYIKGFNSSFLPSVKDDEIENIIYHLTIRAYKAVAQANAEMIGKKALFTSGKMNKRQFETLLKLFPDADLGELLFECNDEKVKMYILEKMSSS